MDRAREEQEVVAVERVGTRSGSTRQRPVQGIWMSSAGSVVAHLVPDEHYRAGVDSGCFHALCGAQLRPASLHEQEQRRCDACGASTDPLTTPLRAPWSALRR